MVCKRCGSENVNVQMVSKVSSRGGTVPWWYWILGLWFIDFMLYLFIIGFFGVNINHFFKKTKTKAQSYAVCQDCGCSWRV